MIAAMSSPERDVEDAAHVQRAASDPDLMHKRAKAAATSAPKLRKAGQAAHVAGHLVGDGSASGASSHGNGADALVGVGVLAQIAADLLDAAGALLSGTNHYAGAALLRQIVEVEYLTWAFANQKRDAADWLNSTHAPQERYGAARGARLARSGARSRRTGSGRHSRSAIARG